MARERVHWWRAQRGRDDGAAVVEFLGVTVLLLVPIIYVVIAFAHVQAATYAVEGASRTAARGAVVAGMDALEGGATVAQADAAARARAGAAVDLALEDFDVAGERTVALHCDSDPCLAPGGAITAHVAVAVPLPGVPSFVLAVVPATVEVSAVGRAAVDGLVTP